MIPGIFSLSKHHIVRRLQIALLLSLPALWIPASVNAETVRLEPANLTFGSLPMDVCRSHQLIATNIGDKPIPNPEFSVSEAGAFRIQPVRDVPDALLPGESCIVYLRFCPPLIGSFEAEVSFTGTQETIKVRGTGNPGP